ncbi:hypothetical protein BN873_470079 [Candidatus Competibacter denitrificans Run_A_D11]|uniref:Uncharacterized protein n=1 Tax=Candidatus Competibacter denitrificans Run_A_D11 TaxID=1400863 RepID=W6M6M8_9GAMM|nr:hypothetical protein BN873_470079 [Candidatus Competibacter denitrificans Run_A_D11]
MVPLCSVRGIDSQSVVPKGMPSIFMIGISEVLLARRRFVDLGSGRGGANRFVCDA